MMKEITTPPTNQWEPFLKALYDGTEYDIELRALPSCKQSFIKWANTAQIEGLIKDNISQNLYFGVSTREGQKGDKEATREVPALWVDIDFKDFPGGEEEAKEFLGKTLNIPTSVVVHSGNGYHLYWFFKEPEEARPEIEAYLKGLAKRLRGDIKAAELARILRIPGTFNYKDGGKKLVRLIKLDSNLRYNLSDFEDFKDDTPVSDAVAHTVNVQEITDRCAFLKYCHNNRATIPEPLWYAMVSNVARTSPGGPDLVHALSQGHPGYSKNETDQKMLHAMNDAGPHTCQNIKETMKSYIGRDCGKYCHVKAPIALFNGKVTVEVKEQEAEKILPFGEAANIPLWIDTEPLKREELFEGFLIKGIVGGLFAQGGVGKTFFLLCLMISAALGRPLFKSFRPARPLRVLAVLGEDPGDEIHRRVRSILQEYGKIDSELLTQNLQLYCGKGAPLMQFDNGNPTATAAFKWLKIMVEDFNPDLIFIDPKSMFYGLDENQNDHNTQWVIMLRELTAWGASVVYSHHVTKAMAGSLELNGARGGSALVDGSRFAANMRQLADEDSKKYDIEEPWRYVEFKVTKNSYIPKLPGSIFFKFTTGGALEEVDLQANREYLLVDDLLSALTSEAAKGNYPSRREVEREGNILPDHTQRDRKKAVELALNAGHIITEKDGVRTILRLNNHEVVQVVQDACADLII